MLLFDDFGIQPLDDQSRSALLEIIEERHGKSSTIIYSQMPISMCQEIIGEQTIANATLDRILNDAHRIKNKGKSLPKKKQPVEQDEIEILNLKN